MKNYLLIFLFISTSAFSSEIESKFTWKEKAPFIDYIGCVIANNNIICYGTNSSYVISSDGGKTWNQGKIGDVGTIIKLEYIDKLILGFSQNGNSIISKDNGITWETKKLNFLDTIYDIKYNSEFFFIRGFGYIKVVDKNFNLVSNFTNKILTFNYVKYDPKNIDRFNLNIIDDKIYFDNLTNKLYSLNKDSFISNKTILDTINICDTCKSFFQGMREFEKKIYLLISKNYPTNKSSTHQFVYDTKFQKVSEFGNPDLKINYSKYYKIDSNTFQVYSKGDNFGFNFTMLNIKK